MEDEATAIWPASFTGSVIVSLENDKEKLNGNVVLRGSSQMMWHLSGDHVFLKGPAAVENAGTLPSFVHLVACSTATETKRR